MELATARNNLISLYSPTMRGEVVSTPKPNVVELNAQKSSINSQLKAPLEADTVEISAKPKKKKLSKGAKWAIAIGSAAAVTVLALKFGPRIYGYYNAKKLIPVKNLPEKN